MAQRQRNTRMITRVLYRLKHRYGGDVSFVRDSETLDLETGTKTVTKATWDTKHVILLPNVMKEKFVYDLTYIASNKNFTYGGVFDTSRRRLILDLKDAGTYVPQNRDYLTFEGDRWNVVEVHFFEFGTGYLIIGQRVKGAPARNVFNRSARGRTIFSDAVALEVL